MVKKVVAIGSCLGVEEILLPKGYVVEHAEQKSVLDVLKKEGIEAVIVDIDDTVRFNVVISGIRHLYPGLWITAISGNKDSKERSLALKAGASSYVKKPIDEKNLSVGEEEPPVSEPPLQKPAAPVPGAKKSADSVTLDESKKIFPGRFYNAFFVTEYGKLETLRAERYNKNFSIILTHIERFRSFSKKL